MNMDSPVVSCDVVAEYDEWHEQMGAGSGAPLRFPRYASVVEEFGSGLTGEVPEGGCGRGEFAHWLARTAPNIRVTGIDFSAKAIEIANRRTSATPASIQFLIGDAQSLKFPDNSFDWVVSGECMEHVPSPRATAAEIFRELKPGDRFCLTTENYLSGMLLEWVRCWLTKQPFNSGSGVQP
jgi:ubiquinone/menaquinone biosynthesis C-methylase UbiE